MKLKDVVIVFTILSFGATFFSFYHFFKFLFDGGFDIDRLTINVSYIFSNILQFIFLIIGVVGLIRYFTSQNIYNRLLKVYLLHLTFIFFIHIPTTLHYQYFSEYAQRTWISIGFNIFYLSFAIITILFYTQQKVNVIPAPVKSQSTRFVHYILDAFYVNVTLFTAYGYYLYNFDFAGEGMFITAYAMLIVGPFFYYLISESCFRQTIGKIVTGSYVRSKTGGAPGFGRILGRSLCRYIPFEAFSYLPSPMAKWHDQISGTDVFKKSDVDMANQDPILDHLINEDSYHEL